MGAMARHGSYSRGCDWSLEIADNVDMDTAECIATFIRGLGGSRDHDSRRSHSGAYYYWKISQNPHGRGYVSLAMKGERIVGTTTLTWKRAWLGDRWVPCGEIGDTFTDPAFRRQGIFTSLVSATRDRALADGMVVIYGTPNAQSLPGYVKKCGFFSASGFRQWLCVLPLRPLQAAKACRNKLLRHVPTALVDSAVSRLATLDVRRLPRMCAEAVCSFNGSFDELDLRLRERCTFLLSRAGSELDFRFNANPDADQYMVLTCCSDAGELDGALIYKDVAERGIRILYVVDRWAVSANAEYRLWQGVRHLGRISGHCLIVCWVPKRKREGLLSYMPVPPIPIREKEVVLFDTPVGREVGKAAGAGRLALMDTDNI